MQKSSNDLLPIAAVHSQVPVAHHSFNIVLEILGAIALVLVLRTHHVLAMAPSTMPVLPEAKKWSRRPTIGIGIKDPPAVVLVGVVAIRQFRAIEGWLVRATGWGCFSRLACERPISADCKMFQIRKFVNSQSSSHTPQIGRSPQSVNAWQRRNKQKTVFENLDFVFSLLEI